MTDAARLSRRHFLAASAAGAMTCLSRNLLGQSVNPPTQLVWHDVREWGCEGQGWTETASPFDRLPARAEGKVPPNVWTQSRHSAGMFVRFRTSATEIWTEHHVGQEQLATPDLASIGYSGLDLYAKDEAGTWKWLSVTRPKSRTMRGALISGLIEGERDYQLYLPLYNRTELLKVGIPAGASFTPIMPRREKPIAFYGTSITQGASASRPGMPHVAILGRRLNRPVLNLGFGGAGKMEREVGDFLAELDPAAYVIDCLPNMTASEVAQRAAPLVRQLKTAHPETRVVLVEDRTYPNAAFLPGRQRHQQLSREALRHSFEELQSEGISRLWYVAGETLLGEDREDTSDGTHPTDLGFWRQANTLEPVLRSALA